MILKSPAFAEAATIPEAFTCDGANRSPALAWSDLPAAAHSLALTCTDPDAPGGTFHHWAVYDMPPSWGGLAEAFGTAAQAAVRQGVNDFGHRRYDGPCPPRGAAPHHYHFRLSALGGPLDLPPAATCAEVATAVKDMEIDAVELVGLYGR
jgi:Raf kinase inhibitor-like YbhB/YbcL family protein